MTDRLRAAAEAALEALEKATRFMSDKDYQRLNQTIELLRAALAEHENEGGSNCTASQRMNPHFTNTINPIDFPKSKYTAPPRRE